MFRSFMTKSMFRISMVAALLMFVGVFVFAFHLERYNLPPEGMKAPFGSSGHAEGTLAAQEPTGTDLSIQNFSGREIAFRLTEIVAEALSFDKSNFVYNSGQMQQYFTPAGFQQYQQFLTSTSFEPTLRQSDLQSGAFTEQEPLELSSGVYGGTYKWLFEVPVTISFIPRQMETYRSDTPPQNRRVLLRAQFTRVKDAADPNAVKIEIWQILPPRKI